MGDRFSRETRSSLIKWALADSLCIMAVMLARNLLKPEANPSADPSIPGSFSRETKPARKAGGPELSWALAEWENYCQP